MLKSIIKLFSEPRRGIHKHRTLHMSTFELCFMTLFCLFISKKTKTSFATVLFYYLNTGKIIHYLYR